MKIVSRVILGVGCVALLLIAWFAVLSAQSAADKQAVLIDRANNYLADEIYIRAVPLLEEAAAINAEHTQVAETKLKALYLKLTPQQGYQRKYINLLQAQMGREDATAEVFEEAARFYLEQSKVKEALEALRNGIGKTGDAGLTALYETNRYGYQLGRAAYEDVTTGYGGTIAVQADGLWGLASAGGSLMLPCRYDKVSTYGEGKMIVRKDGVVMTVDSAGNRLALLKENATDFGNYANDRVPIEIGGQWLQSTSDFAFYSAVYEALGTYYGGYTAAKADGKWGVVDGDGKWLIPPQFDGIVMDELGRCYAQGAVFVRQGNGVQLYVDGAAVGGTFEDARPFGSTGLAAVKQGGRWGFADTTGTVQIACRFDDALSFGQHMAAVKVGELWGYISDYQGEIVIEPQWEAAKSFSEGSAPVLTEQGWQFITLIEYKG